MYGACALLDSEMSKQDTIIIEKICLYRVAMLKTKDSDPEPVGMTVKKRGTQMKRQKTRNIVRSRQRKQWIVSITKTFSDSNFGSKEKSLEAATKLRNTIYGLILADFKKPYIQENVQYYENVRPNKVYKSLCHFCRAGR